MNSSSSTNGVNRGVFEMGIETAFLFGVLVGQWIMFWAMWRRVSVLSHAIASLAADLQRVVRPGGAMIDLSREEYRDDDLFEDWRE